jgi:uncharacterized protein YndB with AHSA1/START domain
VVSSIISLTRDIPAPAAAVFDLLARPGRHAQIDGSGSVRGVRPDGPDRLFLGARFGMDMRIGLPYRVRNEVVEFEEGRRIAWRHFAGHVWRYLLEPSADPMLPSAGHGVGSPEPGVGPSTRLTEQFDPTGSHSPRALKLLGFGRRNERAIRGTLDQIADLARAGTL